MRWYLGVTPFTMWLQRTRVLPCRQTPSLTGPAVLPGQVWV